MTQGVSRAGWIGSLIRDYLVEDEFNEDVKDVTVHKQQGESQKLTVYLEDGSSLTVIIEKNREFDSSDWYPFPH